MPTCDNHADSPATIRIGWQNLCTTCYLLMRSGEMAPPRCSVCDVLFSSTLELALHFALEHTRVVA
jgi:hypothetical protein